VPFLLPVLAMAQALGILLADRIEPSSMACWFAAGVALAAAVCVRRPAPRVGGLACAAALAGAASLAGPLEAARRGPSEPREASFEATAGAVSWHADRVRVDWKRAVALEGSEPVPPGLRLYGRRVEGPPVELQTPRPGERWRIRARLRRPAPLRNPGGSDRARSLARRGIGATGARLHPGLAVRVGPAGGGPMRALRIWRERRAARLTAAGPGGGLLAALALGERRALPSGARRDFARLGLSHLLAVSGLHLALAAAACFWWARAILVRVPGLAARFDVRRLALAAAVPAAVSYAALSGFGVPVQRALVLLLAAVLALGLRRPRRRAAPLALASFLLLARAPHELFTPGFQLSFGATAALLFSHPGTPRRGPGSRRPVVQAAEGLLRTSASALLATAPVAGWHFGGGSSFALLANLLAIPLTAGLLLPAAAAAVLAAGLGGTAAAMVLHAAERIAFGALTGVSLAAQELAPAVPVVASGLALAAAAAVAAFGIRRAGTGARLLVLAFQTAWLAAAGPAAVTPPAPRVVVLDVGQGDATLVQGRRAVLLVDAGPRSPSGFDAGERVVLPALAALGIGRIDRLAVTHADLDHRGGVPAILAHVPVGAVWLPRGAAADAGFAGLRRAAARAGVPILERGAGDGTERIGDLSVAFLWPAPGARIASRNDGSLVLRVAGAGGRSMLLPGDVGVATERALLARGGSLASDLLLLPHHGSRTSSSAGFLAAVSPRLALVSAPCRGRFPMPHGEVRERLAALRVPLHWTRREGALIVGLDPRMVLRTWGKPRRRCFGSPGAGRKQPLRAVFSEETR